MDEARLVSAIENAPDDEAALLAYGEHLRRVGDPRGPLVATGVKPKAAQLKALVGTLAAFGASVKIETWRLGFADHVRLIADDEKHAQRLIEAIATHPSTRFVRTLEVVILGKRRSYAGVDARLADLACPKTLTSLVLGKPGDHALSRALLEAFPRVGAAPRRSWDEVAAAVRAVRGSGPGFATAPIAIPALPLTSGELVRGLAAEIDRNQPLGLCARLVEECTPSQLAELSAALITAWTQHGGEARDAWVYEAAARFGGADAARLIGQQIATSSHARAEHAIDTLARIEHPLAILELFEASRHWTARGERAEVALERRVRDVPGALAQAGSDPRCAGLALDRFRQLDDRAIESLMVTGWSAPLATVRRWFAGERARQIVWRSGDEMFALAGEHTVSHDGAAVDILPEQSVTLVHVADPEVRDVVAWRAWQTSARFDQLSRTAPPHGSRDELEQLATRAVDVDALRERGYRNGGVKTDDTHEELHYVKTYQYRGDAYPVTIALVGPRSVVAPRTMPAVVQFEIARDLGART
ncbi:MAG: hypothetical protein H0T46_02155 [Deltaproteobacteria bacterium]|nr:hypothetical protein [Deltaproteobacteria bacterium]